MDKEANSQLNEGEGKQQRCTAPHPAKSLLWSLPAFAVALAAVVIWRLL